MPDGKGGRKIGRTLNHQVGCKEVSPACRLCYAAKLAHRGMSEQHKGLTVMRTNAAGEALGVHWNGAINRVPKMLEQPLRWRKPSGIFVGSMTDTFFDVSTDEACRWIAALFGVMAATPQHTYMLLTKRPENAAKWFAWLADQAKSECEIQDVCMRAVLRYAPEAAERMRRQQETSLDVWPLSNCWLGVTAEDQRRADERIPILLGLPAAVRYVSYEPACSAIDFAAWLPRAQISVTDPMHDAPDGALVDGMERVLERWEPRGPWLDWLIAGGESGPGASPSHPDWFRSARDQCAAAGVPFFFKQWGEWSPAADVSDDDAEISRFDHREWLGDSWSISSRPMWDQWDAIDERQCVARVGKNTAGRVLDGETHDGFPKAAHA